MPPPGPVTDQALYRKIAAAVRHGDGYYAAAISQQRLWHYPVRPFVTVRLPTLAWFQALVGEQGLRVAALIATACAVLFWLWRLDGHSRAVRIAGCGAVAACGLPLALSPFIYFHDFWAGLCLTFALGLRRAGGRLAAGTAAALIRELAVPFLVVQAFVYAIRRRGKAAWAATLALAAVGAALTLHRAMVMAATSDADLVSPGWHGMRGAYAVVADISGLTVLQFLPLPLAAGLVFAPLLGWFEFSDDRAGFGWFAVFLAAIAVLSRTDNIYWAANVLPAYFVGLAFVPAFFRAMWRQPGSIEAHSANNGKSSAQPTR